MAAIVEQRKALHIGRVHLQPVFFELEIAHNFIAEKALNEGAGRPFRALDELLGHARAADHLAGLEDTDLATTARQIVSGAQPVVSGADNRDVIIFSHYSVPRSVWLPPIAGARLRVMIFDRRMRVASNTSSNEKTPMQVKIALIDGVKPKRSWFQT